MRPDAIERWATQIVDYALDIQDGDRVEISFDAPAKPLALAVYEKTVQQGAYPETTVRDSEFSRLFYRHASDDQLDHPVPDDRVAKYQDIDKSLSIRAPENLTEHGDIDPTKQQQRQHAPGMKQIREERLKNTTWSLTQYPTKALAQNAGMSTQAYEEFIINACVKDWKKEREKYMELKEIVDNGSEVHIKGYKTDLRFRIDGHDGVKRVGVLSDGTSNIPGGEVFTTPVKESFRGHIHFELPAMVQGKEVNGITIRFGEDGRIKEYEAEKGEELLEKKIETDDGSRFIGEFGIGTNFGIDRPTRDILFDEKIGGTIHLAVGRAYEECMQPDIQPGDINNIGMDPDTFTDAVGKAVTALRNDTYEKELENTEDDTRKVFEQVKELWSERMEILEEQRNDSVVHWDMIKDLRENGEFSIDGRTVLKDGRFVGVDGL